MISRREFAAGATALCTALQLGLFNRPLSAQSAEAGVSRYLAALVDGWEAEGRCFNDVHFETFRAGVPGGMRRAYQDSECTELRRWREAARELLQSTARVMREPAQGRADVILKYHVLDRLSFTGAVDVEALFIEEGGHDWYLIVEHEAKQACLDINYFWRWGSDSYARIDGDRQSPQWELITKWRAIET